MIGADRFLVVHLSAPVEVCRQRDTAGLYAAVDAGEIANLPGVTTSYEVPQHPDLVLPTHELSVDECVSQIRELLAKRDFV